MAKDITKLSGGLRRGEGSARVRAARNKKLRKLRNQENSGKAPAGFMDAVMKAKGPKGDHDSDD